MLVDERVSFRLLAMVQYTVGQAGFEHYVLAARTPVGTITGNWTDVPRIGGGRGTGTWTDGPPPGPPPLNLAIAIQANGFILAGSGGVLDGPDGGPTLALKPGVRCGGGFPSAVCFDLDGLTTKLVEIKRAFPGETIVIINVAPDAPFGLVHEVFERAREHDGAILFPQQIVSVM